MDLSREIAVSPGQFVIDSSRKFAENYDMGKRLGGGKDGF